MHFFKSFRFHSGRIHDKWTWLNSILSNTHFSWEFLMWIASKRDRVSRGLFDTPNFYLSHFLILPFSQQHWSVRSSHQRCSIEKSALKNFAKFTGKYLCQSLFFNKVAGLKPATFLKERLWHRYFPVNFKKFLITLFLQNIRGWLILKCCSFILQELSPNSHGGL